MGIKREDANEMVKQIVGKYVDNVSKDGGPGGHTFLEIHDKQTLEIKPKYLEVYDKVKSELSAMGLDFQY